MVQEQLPLLGKDLAPGAPPPPLAEPRGLSARTSLAAAANHFQEYMQGRGLAENTISSFLGDLRLLRRHLGATRRVGEIGTDDVRGFLRWLQHERGKPCSPKSLARRLTTMKVFFGWLAEERVIDENPAAVIEHKPTTPPLPRVLHEGEVHRVLNATRRMMAGDEPDARPHLLVTLLLATGIKKGECMRIRLAHIDRSNPAEAVLHVRYDKPTAQHKERRLRLPPGWGATLDRYVAHYEVEDRLFPWTGRNLEYVLHDVSAAASLGEPLTFEVLRWTCAARDFRTGLSHDHLRRKMGWSKMSWRETLPKLQKLAEPAL
jgi:site-specific recombinase XerD